MAMMRDVYVLLKINDEHIQVLISFPRNESYEKFKVNMSKAQYIVSNFHEKGYKTYDEYVNLYGNRITKEEFNVVKKCYTGKNETTFVMFVKDMYGYDYEFCNETLIIDIS